MSNGMSAVQIKNKQGSKGQSPFVNTADVIRLHRGITDAARAVGEQMERSQQAFLEGQSLNGDHLMVKSV